jgi:arylsulfatase A-like enzyme
MSAVERTEPRPSVVLILADDLGYSDLGCYGGEIRTPHLDALGRAGVRLTQFYNTARCSPSRASLLTGLHPHQTGIGILTNDDGPSGYPGTLNRHCLTLAEVLQGARYDTAMFGKWHLVSDVHRPGGWPVNRGFNQHWGTLGGGGSYYRPGHLVEGEQRIDAETLPPDFYYTEAISDRAVSYLEGRTQDSPFFLYVAYTAPHWPLHAPAELVRSYAGAFDEGWDVLRGRRLQRLKAEGIIAEYAELSPRFDFVLPWEEVDDRAWEAHRMMVYAAQVEAMDRGVGRIVDTLEASGRLADTLLIFLSDNGASSEIMPQVNMEHFRRRSDEVPATGRSGEPMRIGNQPSVYPGPSDTYVSCGPSWANLSNTPFRMFKKWVHQGGIATPFLAHWPAGDLADRSLVRSPHQLTDVVPTLLDACGVGFSAQAQTQGEVLPPEGRSFLDELRGGQGTLAMQFWEHTGNAALRDGDWKLVRFRDQDWELYNLAHDPTELTDLAEEHPGVVDKYAALWQEWADRVGVLPWEVTVQIYRERGESLEIAGG